MKAKKSTSTQLPPYPSHETVNMLWDAVNTLTGRFNALVGPKLERLENDNNYLKGKVHELSDRITKLENAEKLPGITGAHDRINQLHEKVDKMEKETAEMIGVLHGRCNTMQAKSDAPLQELAVKVGKLENRDNDIVFQVERLTDHVNRVRHEVVDRLKVLEKGHNALVSNVEQLDVDKLMTDVEETEARVRGTEARLDRLEDVTKFDNDLSESIAKMEGQAETANRDAYRENHLKNGTPVVVREHELSLIRRALNCYYHRLCDEKGERENVTKLTRLFGMAKTANLYPM